MLDLILYDLKALLRARLAWGAVIIAILCCTIAAVSGGAWMDRLSEARSDFLQTNADREAEFRARFAGPEWTDADSADAPYTIRRALAYPVPLLADFTIGRSDVEPAMAQVRMGFRSDMLFRNYQIDNPDRMMRGHLDLSLYAVAVAPLLLIALGFGVLSSDVESGRARLVLAQAGGFGRLLVARSVTRLALVALPMAVAAVAMLVTGPQIDGRWSAGLLWLGAAFVGLLFWWAVILIFNTLRLSSESTALALVAAWTVLVFVAPTLITIAARTVYPPPSRMEQIILGREAELRATETYRNEHATDGLPEVQRVKDVVAEYHRITRGLERSIAPVTARFDTQLARQNAWTERLQHLSPSMTIAGTLSSIAGTDTRAYQPLRVAARDYLETYMVALDRGIANNRLFTLADHDGLPRFSPPPAPAPNLAGLAWTAFVTLLLLGGTALRLRRLSLT